MPPCQHYPSAPPHARRLPPLPKYHWRIRREPRLSPSASPTPHRIHLPTSSPSIPASSSDTPSPRSRRSNTLDSSTVNYAAARQSLNRVSDSPSSPISRPLLTPNVSAPTLHRRPTSLYATPHYSTPTPPDRLPHLPSSSLELARALPASPSDHSSSRASYSPSHSPTPSSVMSPTLCKSSYMASRKASTYGQIGVRGLGRHLPRIASGDGDDAPSDHDQASSPPVQSSTHKGKPVPQPPLSPVAQDRVASGLADSDDVAGKHDPKDRSYLTSAVLALVRGLWADTRGHLLQAYEYLCHVGEAQQWIEGCLGEELGFGVVLAKLVRAFQGGPVVRRIYESSKLDFRHSDNINHFWSLFVKLVFQRQCFIFELTDLYKKKNLPKVIYCIHPLSHLLARRGLAQRIGNLLGQLQVSDDQLSKTQKGLSDAGVPMPNFGDVGRELAKGISEDPEVEIETEGERRDRLLLESEDSIRALRCLACGFLVRKALATQYTRLRFAERYVSKIQGDRRSHSMGDLPPKRGSRAADT
ncbi:hypothetical protein JVT61DRAFT_15591 [Boletus reticuloceps]|uniref:Uncharacterized protein n=1 Tax=Boletus reticuloceps TaxID=495285 RepID=A0A8I3A255_9AGAM|nr:hypothetical protein JVT61DRAFT_15591 [Boletus reticuloceps]